ncbi:prepilin-type N-terminal cleavage/methylation domain-containing protein [Shewanella eurypsychrophilus]|uniref:Prepilin-type N-terminal cleavage/methylation domain-containing protein n=1 Tax=Shewanella eurypsychrophilus TaxID=2593656 RepID=A0ABX6VA18_9GAMM|nr:MULTISPECIES: prepilin-type N-terminal cleavage/methylation domain-containing protein [Shewanella]QFU23451.1 prepilin-type N-terminal cleavage/methylation domain-containing protein [Shewanella sp. YLB-09]QPG58680.1 prepilin-type N-terminal cleavage/methylation domain-containing protein [Shewanella eurypsychrophilus]
MALKRSHGFTLIEMLISMVLLMGIIAVSSFAYSQFSRFWDGRVGHFYKTFYDIRHHDIIKTAISGITPYVAFNTKGHPRYYFEGKTTGFVAVSGDSISQPGKAAVIRIFVEQNNDFSYKLVYQESPMDKQLLTRTDQAIEYTYTVVVDKQISDVEFNYYGEEKSDSSQEAYQRKVYRWFSEFNSLATMIPPEKIQLKWSANDREYHWLIELTSPIFPLSRYSTTDE